MKIAYIRYSCSFEFGIGVSTAIGATEMRTRLFKEFLKENIEIDVYSKTSKDTKLWLQNESNSYFGENVKNLRFIDDRLTMLEDVKYDLMIVECGPDNLLFSSNVNKVNLPDIVVSNNLIKSYKGLVFYYQLDLELPFVFFPEFFGKKYDGEYSNEIGHLDLFRDKKWIIGTPTTLLDPVIENEKGNRNNYKDLKELGIVEFERFEPHYACINFEEHDFAIKNKGEYVESLCYVGGERGGKRKRKLVKFYDGEDLEKLPSIVWGKWTEDTMQKYNSINWKGVLQKGLPVSEYNKYFGSVVIADPLYEKAGCITQRLFEIIQARSLPFIDHDLRDTFVTDILSKELLEILLVKDRKDVVKLFELLNGSEERGFIIQECVNSVMKFSPKNSFQNFIEIYEKYSDLEINDNISKVKKLFKKMITSNFEKFPNKDFPTYLHQKYIENAN